MEEGKETAVQTTNRRDYNRVKTTFKAGKPKGTKDIYNVFPKRHHGNKLNQRLRSVCNGIKIRIRNEKDPDKKAMWAIIGLELNELLLNLE